ncbi:YktB family protein [Caenibacillus caldisaponilyticus]|uniref:YktB family protein n=1 Tax=Caenibacillus caldisaponilyticus TaxID=1674942 RepID=UPI0009888FCA|nr:DUF1054 domain-containing protein [Caenibacillus caldisaponilyticus]
MAFTGFTEKDFEVFAVEGLEPRMQALIATVRPKLEALGEMFAPMLTAMTGEDVYAHVAKHARRTVHPPDNTWVAFSSDKRGYKKHPHFQIGLWRTHVFVWFAVLDEAANKAAYARALAEREAEIRAIIPPSFVWSTDHTRPETVNRLDAEMIERLGKVKKAELLCGVTIPREEAVRRTDLIEIFEQTFTALAPLYQWTTRAAVLL